MYAQRRVQAYDAAGATGAHHCQDEMGPSPLIDDVIHAPADALDQPPSDHRPQMIGSQAEVSDLARPEERWNTLYAEPIESAGVERTPNVGIDDAGARVIEVVVGV